MQMITMGAQARVLEEVMVTAQKREQSLQDVGIAVSAFTGEQIERLGYDNSTEIVAMTPGVHVGGNLAGQNLQYTIRGVAQNDFNDHTESPVAAYIDETYIAMAQGQRFAMFDLERVEVLKGPQGTLFGRNATGGLVHFITRKPTFEPDGYLLAQYGRYDKVRVEGAFSNALSDTVAARVSALYTEHDNYLGNDYDPTSPVAFNPDPGLVAAGGGDDLGRNRDIAVRAHLLFQPGEDFSFLLSGQFADTDMSSSPYQTEATAAVIDAQGRQRNAIFLPADAIAQAYSFETGAPINSGIFGPYPRPVPGGDATGYIDPDGRDLDHSASDMALDDLSYVTTYGFAGKLDWDFDGLTLVSVSDYKVYEKFIGMDVDSAPMNQLSVWFDANVWQATQEVRLQGETARTQWVAGVYYMHVDYDNYTGFKVLPNAPLLLPPGTAPAEYPAHVEQKTDSYSVFGQLDFSLTDSLVLTAGLRVIQEEKDYDYALQIRGLTVPREYADGPLFGVFSDVVGLPVSTATSQNSSDTLWTGKLQLNWHVDDDLLLYGGINRGVKAGGFNSPIDFGGTQLVPGFEYGYDEEVLLAYEGGFKSTLFGGTTQLNGSLYYYDYKDYQGFVFAGVSGIVVNYDSTVVGGELELITSPVEGLDLMLSVASIDANVEDVEVAPGVFMDREPSYVPPFEFSAMARYAWPAFNGEVAVQSDVSYVDRFYYTLRNYDSHKLESYWLANARVSYTTRDGAWELAAFVENLTDKAYPIMGFDISVFCGCSEIAVGTPRWWGVSLRRNF